MANKFKCTPELTEKLCELLREGAFRESACATVGITSHTMRRWIALAEQGDERYADFALKVAQSEAKVEHECVFAVKALGADDWRALAWFLEKRFPSRYGDNKSAKIQLEREREALFEALSTALTSMGMESAIEHVLRELAERGEETTRGDTSGAKTAN